MAVYRAYVASNMPLNGEITVTHASTGPAKFSVRLKKRNLEFLQMCSELESCALRPLPGSPVNGTACIAVLAEKVHRALVLCSSEEQQTFKVCLVDIGCVEVLPEKMLFQIPDNIMAYRLFSTIASLVNGEALSAKPGLNEIFNLLVSNINPIASQVVKVESNHEIIELKDIKGQSIASLALGHYNDMILKLRGMLPTPPLIPKIEILDPPLMVETLIPRISQRVGHFFAHVERTARPLSGLTTIFNHLEEYYEILNPLAQRLAVGNFIGYTAVVKYAAGERAMYYRCRILEETEKEARISMIDFDFVDFVPRQDLYEPPRTRIFCQPAYGIHCVISCEDGTSLKKEDWDAALDTALIDKTVKVRIVSKEPDGTFTGGSNTLTYTVSLADDPLNREVRELLNLQTSRVQVKNPPAQLSSASYTAPRAAPAESRPSNTLAKAVTALIPPQGYQHPNNRMSVPETNLIVEGAAAAPVSQEVVGSTRGPPPTGNEFKRGLDTNTELATPSKVADALFPAAKAIPSTRPVPVPTQIDVPTNIRTILPTKDTFEQRLLFVSTAFPEILRGPSVLQITQLENPPAQRSTSSNRAPRDAPKVADAVLPVAKATPSTRSVPAPTATYAFLPTLQQSVAVAWFYSFDRFYLSPIALTAYETELESLNGYYAGLSGTELVEDSPKVGLPCVVKFRDDNMFYRSQIVTMFPDKTAQILFVDYGNEQVTPLTEIRRIVPKFMKIPQMILPCKLAGVDGVQQGSEIKLTADDDLVATFLSVDKGVHHVKIMHKIHGDMAIYVTKNSTPVLRPAISQLRDPKCQNIEHEILGGNGIEIAQENDASTVNNTASLPPIRKQLALKEEAMITRINPIKNQEELTLISAIFVGCTSPNAIYLRTPELAESFIKLHHELQSYFQAQQISLCNAPVNLFVGFIGALQYGDQWFRVKVVNVDKYPDISVLLFDIALSLNVNAGEIHHLPGGWKTYPKTLLCFSFSGVRPPSGTAWGPEATEYVSELLTGAERITIEYRNDAEGLSTKNAVPVAVYVHETCPNLEPDVSVSINIRRQLVNLGLAAPTDYY